MSFVLQKYHHDTGLMQLDVAERAGISVKRYNHYVTGKRRPDRDAAVAISRATDGVVSVSELLEHVIPDGYELRKIEQDDTDLANIQKMINEAQESRREAGA